MTLPPSRREAALKNYQSLIGEEVVG